MRKRESETGKKQETGADRLVRPSFAHFPIVSLAHFQS
jgi:hypothetical protein